MIDNTSTGRYMLRIASCPQLPEIEGQVVYIRGVTANGPAISLTDDCRPLDSVYQLPSSLLDSGWYDVTSLIMEANGIILPKYGSCVFSHPVAVEYRNFLDPSIAMAARVDEQTVEEQLCLLGRATPSGIEFTRTAYFIVARDRFGYILGYSGFCQPVQVYDRPKITQRVLYLTGSGKSLFSAEAIVNACNEAFEADQQNAKALISRAMESIEAPVGYNEIRTEAYGRQLEEMKLH